jgi:diguanylate cyclase (GGDEF)-like protein
MSLPARVSKWLHEAVPGLAFAEPLETQFREWFYVRVQWRRRSTQWLAIGNILLFACVLGPFLPLREQLFGTAHDVLLTLIAGVLLTTSLLALLAVSTAKRDKQYYHVAVQFIIPVHTLCFATMDVLMREQGYTLSAWMPLAIAAPNFIFGLLHFQAARCSILALTAYVLVGLLVGASGTQHWLNLGFAAIATFLSVAISQLLQRGLRHDYIVTQSLNESAHRDSLTGIHNRRMFDEHMTRVWQQAARESVPIGLLLVDLDHFKAFNDTHGHQGGDACLAKVARLLPQVARRPLDLAARYGGEEFMVLLYDARREQVEEACIHLHAALEHIGIAHAASATGQVTFSIGGACVQPKPNRRLEGLIQLADEALYAAKERGRNRTVIMDREYETLTTGAFRSRRVGGTKA